MAKDRDHAAVARRAREDAEALHRAWRTYVATGAALAAITQCASTWPADPPGADYLGTRCDLLGGHDRQGTLHRHRMPGTQVVVEW